MPLIRPSKGYLRKYSPLTPLPLTPLRVPMTTTKLGTHSIGALIIRVLKGSWDLVTRVIIRVTILITPIKILITLLTKSHDPPSRGLNNQSRVLGHSINLMHDIGIYSGPFTWLPDSELRIEFKTFYTL